MAVTISKLAVLLSANANGFNSVMRGAIKPLKDLGSHVASIGSKVIGFGGALTALAAGAGMTALVKSSMESIDATAKLSDRLGIATESLTGLQHAANLSGVSNEQLTGGLEKMMKSLAEAATGGAAAGAAFSKLGLDAKTLANMSAGDAFAAISDGLKGINNPAERAAAAMDIFGKSGQSLLPLMLSGSEGIKAAQEEAAKLGLTFSRVDAAKVEAANDAMTRLQAVFVGVSRTLAIQLSPFIQAAADKLTELAASGDGMAKRVITAFEWVATAVARTTDILQLLKAGWHALRVAASGVLWGLLKPIDAVVQALDWLYQKLTGKGPSEIAKLSADYMREVEKDIKGSFDAAGDAMLAFTEGRNAQAVAQAFQKIRAAAEANAKTVADNAEKMRGAAIATEDMAAKLKAAEEAAKKVTDTLADLQKEVDTFGMSEGQKKLFDLKAMGATPEQLAQAERLLNQLDALNEAKKRQDDLQSRAKSIMESVATPLEKYESTIGNLNELLNVGLLSWDVYGRAVRQAREELEKAGKADVPEPTAPEAFRAGSAAAQRFVYKQSRGMQKMSRDDIPKRQLAEAEGQSTILERIERNTRTAGGQEITVMDI